MHACCVHVYVSGDELQFSTEPKPATPFLCQHSVGLFPLHTACLLVSKLKLLVGILLLMEGVVMISGVW